MRQLKPVIQDAADRINDEMIVDNIDAIKAMVIIDRTTRDAIRNYWIKKDKITAPLDEEKNPIVTIEDIKNAMNREIAD